MMKNCRFFHIISIFSAIFPGLCDAYAQTSAADSLVFLGDSLRMVYRFEESKEAYGQAESMSGDSLFLMQVRDKFLLSENGLNMSKFAYSPTVVAKHRFSLEDFFLYYPLPDYSWHPVPNQLDSAVSPYSKALYAPAGDDAIYYSARDEDGIRNIYKTELRDTMWTLPALINEHITSPADEVYPILSASGKTLYFSSAGLYGVGGYDLYYSEWDEATRDWSVPVNMGFPYSSPADDFLYIDSSDGRYSVFASNRDCSPDSVYVYVLEFDNMPVRTSMDDPEELRRIALLEPYASADKGEARADIAESSETRRYMEQMAVVRALKDSISIYNESLDVAREQYAAVSGEKDREKYAQKILRGEARIPMLSAMLDEAVAKLQKIEMEFLFSGVVIDPDKLQAEADREIVGGNIGYAFSKMNMGEPLILNIEKPQPKFDYSLKVLDVGQFAEDNAIPAGIKYQIQIFSTVKKASLRDLKGLSPVFETRSESGRYIYRVGLFNTYADVLSKLNTVKRAGFKNAFVVGYVDGKEMKVAKVREQEARRKKAEPSFYNVVIIPDASVFDDVAMEAVVQQAAGMDVARQDKDGQTVYSVGPFSDKAKAENLAVFVNGMGYGKASVDSVK